MRLPCCAGLALAATLLLSAPSPTPAAALDARDPDPAWREAASLPALREVLERWLDTHAPYPRAATPPRIRIITPYQAETLAGPLHRAGGQRRGLYDADSATIYLIRPWSPGDARDVSVLLHELAHHRQSGARHWVCPGAQEPEAYAQQAAWLAERHLAIPVNRIAIALAAGCTRSDFHPD